MDGAKINNRAPDGSEMSSINILQSSHIVVENLDVTSYGSAILVADANNIFLRDNYIHDVDGLAYNNLSGVYLTGVRNAEITNNLFTDNYDRSVQAMLTIVISLSLAVAISRSLAIRCATQTLIWVWRLTLNIWVACLRMRSDTTKSLITPSSTRLVPRLVRQL